MKKYPEVITLDNSDDDDGCGHSSGNQNVGATASVICAKPLSFSALQPVVDFCLSRAIEIAWWIEVNIWEVRKDLFRRHFHKY